MQERDHWDKVYLTKSDAEVSWFQARPATSLDLIESVKVEPGHPLIDVGGGASTLVAHLLAAGHGDLTVLDIAAPALYRARARLGPRGDGVRWIVADVTTWSPDRTYAVWHDRAVMHFLVAPDGRAAYARTLRAALAPGGHAIIGTFAPDGPEKCSGLPVWRSDAESLARELGGAFVLVDSRREDHLTPWGSTQKFSFGVFRFEP